MNLYEILDDADGRITNISLRHEKIRWLNQIQRKVFRTINIPSSANIKTVDGQKLYALATDFPTDRIYRLTVDSVEYPYRRLDQATVAYFYYILLTQLGLEPAPSEDDLDIWIFYNKRPVDLCDNLTDAQIDALTDVALQAVTPELPVDYHELYVFALCEKIAKAKEDVTLANNYVSDYNKLLTDMTLQLMNQQPEYPDTRDVMPRTWKSMEDPEVS